MQIYFSFTVLVPVILLALPIFWLVLRRDAWRLWFIVVLSVSLLALLHPAFAVVSVGLVVLTHQLVEQMHAKKLSVRRTVLMAVLGAVVVLALGKYGQVMTGRLWGSNNWVYTRIAMPLGVSYFAFRLLQYVFDQARGVLTENSLLRLGAFVLFLPTFPAGPIETYQGFYGKRSTSFDADLFYSGLRRIIIGYFKKVFVEGIVFTVYLAPQAIKPLAHGWHFSTAQPLQASIFVIYAFMRAYLDLSAYSDLAIGFSRLFGFRIMENFANPLLKRNLSDFWRSWHISLSTWCRNNVYFPVFGATRKVWLGLICSMTVMGLWHYVDLNWFTWAMWHAGGLITVSWWLGRKKAFRKAHRGEPFWSRYSMRHALLSPLWYVMTFCFVALGYSFVATPNIVVAARVLSGAIAGPFVWLAQQGAMGVAGLLVVIALVVGAAWLVALWRRRPQPTQAA
jgi:alginate O-acetyltransferase complex protein AlgI